MSQVDFGLDLLDRVPQSGREGYLGMQVNNSIQNSDARPKTNYNIMFRARPNHVIQLYSSNKAILFLCAKKIVATLERRLC